MVQFDDEAHGKRESSFDEPAPMRVAANAGDALSYDAKEAEEQPTGEALELEDDEHYEPEDLPMPAGYDDEVTTLEEWYEREDVAHEWAG